MRALHATSRPSHATATATAAVVPGPAGRRAWRRGHWVLDLLVLAHPAVPAAREEQKVALVFGLALHLFTGGPRGRVAPKVGLVVLEALRDVDRAPLVVAGVHLHVALFLESHDELTELAVVGDVVAAPAARRERRGVDRGA